MQYPPRRARDPTHTYSRALASERNSFAEERFESPSSTSPASECNFYLHFDLCERLKTHLSIGPTQAPTPSSITHLNLYKLTNFMQMSQEIQDCTRSSKIMARVNQQPPGHHAWKPGSTRAVVTSGFTFVTYCVKDTSVGLIIGGHYISRCILMVVVGTYVKYCFSFFLHI